MSAKPEMRRNVSMPVALLPCPFRYLNIVLPEHRHSSVTCTYGARNGTRVFGCGRASVANGAGSGACGAHRSSRLGVGLGACRRRRKCWALSPMATGFRAQATPLSSAGGQAPGCGSRRAGSGNSLKPRPAGLPARREPPYFQTIATRLMIITVQAPATGSRPPVATRLPRADPLCNRAVRGVREDQRACALMGWSTFPHAVNRNRAPAHLRSRVEWPAHGTQSSRR